MSYLPNKYLLGVLRFASLYQNLSAIVAAPKLPYTSCDNIAFPDPLSLKNSQELTQMVRKTWQVWSASRWTSKQKHIAGRQNLVRIKLAAVTTN